jgi:Reverse transcriptase (RNA-dependent DNA polymerase)
LQTKKRILPEFFEGILVTDFVKAFELVNPYWIIADLRARGAPNWLLQYVEFTLFGRIISPKTRNLILPGLRVKVGVDMGSPLSPLLFCLALDPLLVALNRIPRVYSVRAYMDDNQSAVQSMQALIRTQAAYDLVHTAGLQVTQHSCCIFAPVGTVIFPTGYPSWRRAARHILRDSTKKDPENKFCANNSDRIFTLLQLQAIAGGHPGPILTKLVLIKCECKTKTAFLPAYPLTHAQIARIDGSSWGAKILGHEITVLGLPLRTAYASTVRQPDNRRIPLTSASFDGAFTKALLKVASRTAKLRGTITPVPQLALAFPAWIQSTMYYAASVFQPSNNILQKVLGYFSKTVLGRSWIAKDCVQGVFSAIGIAAGLPLRDSLKLAHLVFCMRRDTPEVVMLAPATTSRKHLDRIIAYYRDTLPLELFGRFRDTCVSIHSTRPKDVVPVLGLLRKFIKQAVVLQGTRYLKVRTERIGWFPRRCLVQLDITWQHLQDLPNAQLGPYVRLGMIRWLLDTEPDDGLYWHARGLHRAGHKCLCNEEVGAAEKHDYDAMWYPHGFGHRPMHIDHFTHGSGWQAVADKRVQSFILSKLPITERAAFSEHCARPISHGPRAPISEDIDMRPFCPFCGYGESSVHHWIVFCPIVNGILAILLAIANISIDDWFPKTHKHLVIVAHGIFHIRRELLALNAFGHGKFQDSIPVPVESRHILIEKLLQTITHSLPFFISCHLP